MGYTFKLIDHTKCVLYRITIPPSANYARSVFRLLKSTAEFHEQNTTLLNNKPFGMSKQHVNAGNNNTNKAIAIILWKFHNDDGMWNANSCGLQYALIVWNIGDFIGIKHPTTQKKRETPSYLITKCLETLSVDLLQMNTPCSVTMNKHNRPPS